MTGKSKSEHKASASPTRGMTLEDIKKILLTHPYEPKAAGSDKWSIGDEKDIIQDVSTYTDVVFEGGKMSEIGGVLFQERLEQWCHKFIITPNSEKHKVLELILKDLKQEGCRFLEPVEAGNSSLCIIKKNGRILNNIQRHLQHMTKEKKDKEKASSKDGAVASNKSPGTPDKPTRRVTRKSQVLQASPARMLPYLLPKPVNDATAGPGAIPIAPVHAFKTNASTSAGASVSVSASTSGCNMRTTTAATSNIGIKGPPTSANATNSTFVSPETVPPQTFGSAMNNFPHQAYARMNADSYVGHGGPYPQPHHSSIRYPPSAIQVLPPHAKHEMQAGQGYLVPLNASYPPDGVLNQPPYMMHAAPDTEEELLWWSSQDSSTISLAAPSLMPRTSKRGDMLNDEEMSWEFPPSWRYETSNMISPPNLGGFSVSSYLADAMLLDDEVVGPAYNNATGDKDRAMAAKRQQELFAPGIFANVSNSASPSPIDIKMCMDSRTGSYMGNVSNNSQHMPGSQFPVPPPLFFAPSFAKSSSHLVPLKPMATAAPSARTAAMASAPAQATHHVKFGMVKESKKQNLWSRVEQLEKRIGNLMKENEDLKSRLVWVEQSNTVTALEWGDVEEGVTNAEADKEATSDQALQATAERTQESSADAAAMW
jgi:regulator of replication initiation timing